MRNTAILLSCCFFALGLAQGADDDEDTTFLRSVVVEKGETRPGDIICILCSVTVKGTVPGDVVAVGGDVEVSGYIQGDVVAAGGRVSLLPGARIDGEPIAVGGSVTRTGRVAVAAEASSVPYFHLPGQRSFHPIGVPILVGFMLLVTVAAAVIFRARQTARVADDLRRRPWLALLLGLAGWVLYFFLEEQLDVDGALPTLGYWLVSGLVLALMLIGYGGLVWLVGRWLARQDGWRAWAGGAVILTIGLLVPVAGAFLVCLLLIVNLGSGIERTAGLAAAATARLWRFRQRAIESKK